MFVFFKYFISFTLLFGIFFQTSFSYAQNLVPNADFEDTVSCTTGLAQVTKAKYWFNLKNTPDYFNDCVSSSIFGVPTNGLGFQYPFSGHAYMGMFTFYRPDTNYREYIGAFLKSPLQIGTKYYVNFKVSMSGGVYQKINIASNKLGILFSTVDYLSTPPPFNNYCQMYADSVITDTLGWTTIRDTFVADSAYSFISIGNFFFNSLLDTIRLIPNVLGTGYYYFDAICISDDSLYCEQWTGLSEDILNEKIKIFPNPSSSEVTIENIPWGCKHIMIYDINGNSCGQKSINGNFKITYDLSFLKQGCYALVFTMKTHQITKKILHIKK